MQKVETREAMDRTLAPLCVVCRATLACEAAITLGQACMRICGHCGSWTYLPRPSAAEQTAIHDNDDYFTHPYFKLRRELTAQRRRCRDLFAELSQYLKVAALRGEIWLDIGCDAGALLVEAEKEFGIVPVGIDISKRAIEAAQAYGVRGYHSTIESAP